MSGRPYTMREMKGIVDYLVEHKGYREIRGRKMWMEYANSSATTRTWQSLKETFLKRILQDIENPYYNLTRDQVCSFKQGCDVEAKEKHNRLEIRTASHSSNNSAENIQQPATKSTEKGNEVEKTPGEEIKTAKIPARSRSSADTVILDESDPQANSGPPEVLLEPTTKSSKECLQFEQSLQPAVKKVLEDFETESESSDIMQIVENPENETLDINKDSELIIIEDSENFENVAHNDVDNENLVVEDGHEVEVGPVFVEEHVTGDHTVQDINNWLKACIQNDKENSDANLTEANKTNAAETNETNATEANETNPSKETEIDVAKQNCDDIVINEVTNADNEINVDPVKSINNVNKTIVDIEKEKVSDAVKDSGDINSNKPLETVEPMSVDGENVEVTSKVNGKISIDNEDKNKDSLSTTADTIIPNNQEVINANNMNKVNTQDILLAADKGTLTRKRSISHDKTINKQIKLDNGVEEKTKKVNAKINTGDTDCDKGLVCNTHLKDTADENKPSTSKDAQMEVVPDKNPCLQSVSLFDEQFNKTKYSDSEVETPMTKNEEKVIAPVFQKKDIIVLKSDSDNEMNESSVQPNDRPTLRYKHLAKAFGFIPGTSATAPRRRSLRCRNRRSKSQRNSFTQRSESSQWETGSASENYVSPPRGRRNRNARRYMKPPSQRILSLDDDGSLFVACRNKIYPLVKDGKLLKTVTYNVGSGSEEEEESFWRQKYVEEKKKTSELHKQLEQVKTAAESTTKRSAIPTRASVSDTSPTPNNSDMNNKMDIEKMGDSGKIQITISKSKEETINLVGHWPQVLPIVGQVMSLFYKTNAVDNEPEVQQTQKEQEKPKEDISGHVTPVIPVVDLAAREKVQELETAIFQEIEERDKVDSTKDNGSYVTKRKTSRVKKTPSCCSEPSERTTRQRKSKKTIADKAQHTTEKTNGLPDIVVTDEATTKPTANTTKDEAEKCDAKITESKTKSPAKTPRRLSARHAREVASGKDTDNESSKARDRQKSDLKNTEGTFDGPATRTQSRRSKKRGNETDTSSHTINTRLSSKRNEQTDDEVRYKLPPEPNTSSARSTPKKARSSEEPHETSGDSRPGNSFDSMQGYQDSDDSPMRAQRINIIKRKRKVSLTVRKGKPVTRRTSFSLASRNMSPDSSNSSYFVPHRTSQFTLDSAVYNSESYQLLMQNRKRALKSLKPFDESSHANPEERQFDVVSKESSDPNIVIEVGSSSNVSLPLSPELSLVENLSISREIIRNEYHPTINETLGNSVVEGVYKQYLISGVDAAIPLMRQDCLVNDNQKPATSEIKAPESFINNVCTINMSYNNSLSESLDKRLRDLLLESAKKITDQNKENQMDVDESIEPPKQQVKKRSSTPQKRKSTKKPNSLGPVIEEHMESCLRGGKNSCPPVITFIPVDENANNSSDINLITNPKARVKKDIIKVKIQRPKAKKLRKVRVQSKVSTNSSRVSAFTDSGINETASISGLFLHENDLTLIHNHSDSCLQTKECIDRSVEIIDNSDSVIYLDSTQSPKNEPVNVTVDMEKLSEPFPTLNALVGSGDKSSEVFATPTNTVYHSPVASNNSLISEDLSDDPPLTPSKWSLLSDDDATNTNTHPENVTSSTRESNFSASLQKLFPIACLVPDLSTISEISRENESRRTDLDTDGDTRSNDYQIPQ